MITRDYAGNYKIEGAKYLPLYRKVVAAVSAGDDKTIVVPAEGVLLFINSIEISPAVGTSVKSVTIDGTDLGLSGSAGQVVAISQIGTVYGHPFMCDDRLVVTVSAQANDTTSYVVLKGVLIR